MPEGIAADELGEDTVEAHHLLDDAEAFRLPPLVDRGTRPPRFEDVLGRLARPPHPGVDHGTPLPDERRDGLRFDGLVEVGLGLAVAMEIGEDASAGQMELGLAGAGEEGEVEVGGRPVERLHSLAGEGPEAPEVAIGPSGSFHEPHGLAVEDLELGLVPPRVAASGQNGIHFADFAGLGVVPEGRLRQPRPGFVGMAEPMMGQGQEGPGPGPVADDRGLVNGADGVLEPPGPVAGDAELEEEVFLAPQAFVVRLRQPDEALAVDRGPVGEQPGIAEGVDVGRIGR